MPLDGRIENYAAPVQPKVDPDAEVLLRAAEIIEQRGWCKQTPCDEAGRVCMGGAISRAIGNTFWVTDDLARLARKLGFGGPDDSSVRGALANWNDFDAQSPAEVIARLREAARG